MKIGKLKIPDVIQKLIDERIWPISALELSRQETNPRFKESLVKKIAPDYSIIYFYPPPFVTVDDLIKKGDSFWKQLNSDSLIPSLTVLIGDFGSGTDTAIALYYGDSEIQPSVFRLEWHGDDANANICNKLRWVKVAENFNEVCQKLELL